MIETALEKQNRMEAKIDRIEAKLMERELYNFKEISDKVDQQKLEEKVQEEERKHKHQERLQLKHSKQLEYLI